MPVPWKLRHSRQLLPATFALLCWLGTVAAVQAHHVLGRPSYSLGEDSNTPSSLQSETQIGNFFVTYMVFPAFPKPGNPGRINLYVTRFGGQELFDGQVTFTVRDDSWASRLGFGREPEVLGRQSLDDGVFRQAFSFHENGSYMIRAAFDADGEPHEIDFPLRVGPPPRIGPIGLTIGILTVVLLTVTVIQRRRSMTGKIRNAHD
ncbi:hypothetical protein [Ruegeria sp. HKCCD8929]|uniref:hypothetical protein n=1 Tax=Ruegeria sp. HKCCD8929 TaxID=2683006 RepID=UPI00148996ED|nr:hypothetical protein [Ruegeria sp. HKCCD8929]